MKNYEKCIYSNIIGGIYISTNRMNERNPLLIPVINSTSSKNKRRGRPSIGKTIKFSAQPKSFIISQLLEKQAESYKNNIDNHTQLELQVDEESLDLATTPLLIEQTIPNGCGVISKDEDHLETNDKLNVKLHYCDYPKCTYNCKLSCNLIKHKRTHSDEKPYLCDQCTFRTKFVNSLKVHKRTHTSERPHSCKHCSYRCNSSSNLKKHNLHRHTEVSKT